MTTYGSVCSGIEAASVAWHPLGWNAVWLAEIEPFPSAVLAHRYPDTPNLGDMTKLAAKVLSGTIAAPDVLVGGTPCQAFSVAGMRQGLDDPRGALTIKYVELADAIDYVRAARGESPAITVWENVPGVLSDKGNAFGCFLGALAGEGSELQPSGGRWTDAGCVYGPKRAIAWRVLDAQYFGLAQRRRRVFVIASARAGFDPAAVLFERDSVRRDIAPSRKAGQSTTHDVAPSLTASGRGVERCGDTRGQDPVVAMPLNTQIITRGRALGRGTGFGLGSESDPAYTLQAGHSHGVATFPIQNATRGKDQNGLGVACDAPMYTLTQSAVRHLTPTECERLQGFPDGWTAIPWRNKPESECPDGPRYKAIGNSKAVPVVRWIGQRIQQALT